MEDRLSLSRTTGPGAVLDAVQSWALQMSKQRPREVRDMPWVTQHEICGAGHQSQFYLLPGPGRGGWDQAGQMGISKPGVCAHGDSRAQTTHVCSCP